MVGESTLILMLPTQPNFDPLIILNLINTHILLNIFFKFFTVFVRRIYFKNQNSLVIVSFTLITFMLYQVVIL